MTSDGSRQSEGDSGFHTPIGSRRTFFSHGAGGAVAQDLSFVGDARPEQEWHLKHFKDPQSVSPGSFMPKFPLTDQQLHDLTGYMLSLKRTP